MLDNPLSANETPILSLPLLHSIYPRPPLLAAAPAADALIKTIWLRQAPALPVPQTPSCLHNSYPKPPPHAAAPAADACVGPSAHLATSQDATLRLSGLHSACYLPMLLIRWIVPGSCLASAQDAVLHLLGLHSACCLCPCCKCAGSLRTPPSLVLFKCHPCAYLFFAAPTSAPSHCCLPLLQMRWVVPGNPLSCSKGVIPHLPLFRISQGTQGSLSLPLLQTLYFVTGTPSSAQDIISCTRPAGCFVFAAVLPAALLFFQV